MPLDILALKARRTQIDTDYDTAVRVAGEARDKARAALAAELLEHIDELDNFRADAQPPLPADAAPPTSAKKAAKAAESKPVETPKPEPTPDPAPEVKPPPQPTPTANGGAAGGLF